MKKPKVTRKRYKVRSLRQLADHEAAHAVLAHKYGAKVVRVVLRRDGVLSGADEKSWQGYAETVGISHPIPASVVVLAGSVAEQLWHGMSKAWVNGADCRELWAMGLPKWKQLERDSGLVWAWSLLWRLTEHEVRRHRAAIRRVSTALMKKDLTGADVRRLIRGK